MNFNIYVDKRTGEQLKRLARMRRTTRNALIRDALGRLVAREAGAEWPDLVRNFTGVPTMPRFESHRGKLKQPSTDPFA
jgi:hypothetical protein